jgi:hypothetical protein
MAEALAPVVDFDVSDADLDVSDFIASPEEADGGVVALGVELGLALGLWLGLDGEGVCARADDSISPLSAVVTNNFLSIEKTSMHVVSGAVMASGTAFRSRFEEKPAFTTPTFDLHRCSAMNHRRQGVRERLTSSWRRENSIPPKFHGSQTIRSAPQPKVAATVP